MKTRHIPLFILLAWSCTGVCAQAEKFVGCFAVVLLTSILVMSSLIHFAKERAFREHGIKTAGELQDAAVSAALV